MTNITQIRPTVRRTIQTHRVTTSLMPQKVQEELMHAAITLGFILGNCEFEVPEDASPLVKDVFEGLEKAVNKACQYTVPSQMEVDEPI